MKILSWNVNGLRACAKKGFAPWLQQTQADIVGLQEVRALREQLPPEVAEPAGWQANFAAAERRGYSGVGLYTRQAPDAYEVTLGEERFDCEGRLQLAEFGALVVANVYFPNGSGKERDNSRIPFKLDFYRALFERLEVARQAGRPVVCMGDFNTAHAEIDLARPKPNMKTSGFCAEERAEVTRWLEAGWVDSFREHCSEGGHYTWWSNRPGVRERNVGWRIDYVLLSEAALPYLREAFILPEVLGSDHCPLGVVLDDAVCRAG